MWDNVNYLVEIEGFSQHSWYRQLEQNLGSIVSHNSSAWFSSKKFAKDKNMAIYAVILQYVVLGFFFSELRLLYTSPYFDSYMDNTRILCIHFSLNEVLNIIAEFITLWHLKKGYSWQERSRFTNILHFYLSQCFNLLCSARRPND